jgi:Helix-turn-helix domain
MTTPKKMAALLVTNATTTPSPDGITTQKFSDRQRRALDALWRGPIMREALDKEVGCSNSPNLIAELRSKGIEIVCEKVHAIDHDGKPCRPGCYSLTEKSRETLMEWGLE